MAINLTELYPEVRIEVPGVPEPVLANGVLKAAQDFFRSAEVWKYSIPTTLAHTVGVDFPVLTAGTDIPTATRVVRPDTVTWVYDGAKQLVPFKTRDELDRLDPNWQSETQSTPDFWTINEPGDWVIVPRATITVASALKLRVVLGLTNSTTTIPDYLFYEFEDALKVGALSRLMKMPGKDWTDIRLAGAYGSAFSDAVVKAKSRSQAEYGQPKRTTTYGGI